jgi:CubicO group peptidase (beta-lactamase class C family)
VLSTVYISAFQQKISAYYTMTIQSAVLVFFVVSIPIFAQKSTHATLRGTPVNARTAQLPPQALALAKMEHIPFLTWAIATKEGLEVGQLGNNETVGRLSGSGAMFHAASISKPVVAASVLLLVQEKKLTLSASAADYLPEFPVKDARWKKVTIEHLLSQTSGLRDLDDYDWVKPSKTDWSSIVPRLMQDGAITFLADPGEKFEYANLNYDLLNLVIAKVSGQSFGEFARQNILAPNGAPSARMSCYDAPKEGVAQGYVFSSTGELMRSLYVPFSKSHAGSSGLCISAPELATWGLNIFDCTRPGAKLSCETVATMREVRKGTYALGWFVDKLDGVPTVEHNGGDVGYNGALIVSPELGVSVAVLTNYEFSSADDIASTILAHRIHKTFKAKNSIPPRQSWSEYAGFYKSEKKEDCVEVKNSPGGLEGFYQEKEFPYPVTHFRFTPQTNWNDSYFISVYHKNMVWFVKPGSDPKKATMTLERERYQRTLTPETDCPGMFR